MCPTTNPNSCSEPAFGVGFDWYVGRVNNKIRAGNFRYLENPTVCFVWDALSRVGLREGYKNRRRVVTDHFCDFSRMEIAVLVPLLRG